MSTLKIELPVTDEAGYQVVVVGGGLAGVCAAVAAARLGARVALVQDRPTLGGNSSSEVRVHPVGASTHGYFRNARETGLVEEAFLDSRYRSAGLRHENGAPYPMWDFALLDLVRGEPTIDLYLNTLALEPIVRPAGAAEPEIEGIVAVQLGTEKVFLLRGEVFVDASGDGRIAAKSGAAYRHGAEGRAEFGESRAPERPSQEVLGSSLLFSARDAGRPVPFRPPAWSHPFPTEADLPYRPHEQVNCGYWWIEWGGQLDTIADNERIRDELTAALFGVWDHIKNRGDHGAASYALEWIGRIPGKRESRRFEGDYILVEPDVMSRRVFADQVAYGGWPIDLHPAVGVYSPDHPCDNPPLPGLYSIPYRCLYSRNVANLFVAGRLISASHVAHGSTRVMKTGAVTGQAAGTAAYLCVRDRLRPRDLYQQPERLAEVQQILLKQGCYLLHVPGQDPADLARRPGVVATASSQAALTLETSLDGATTYVEEDGDPRLATETPLEMPTAQLCVVSADRLSMVELLLCSQGEADVPVTLRLRPASDLRDFYQEEDVAVAAAVVRAGPATWVRFELNAAVAPGHPVALLLDPAEGVGWLRAPQEPPGTQAGTWNPERGYWQMLHGTHYFRLDPPSFPYGPENVLSGVTRPEVGANLWMSDPARPLPQWLELDFAGPTAIDTVYLTFDSNLDGWREEGAFPELVRDYRLLARMAGGGWREVATARGNYQRLRRHRFALVEATGLRLEVEATNGAPSARVYEIRAYLEGGRR